MKKSYIVALLLMCVSSVIPFNPVEAAETLPRPAATALRLNDSYVLYTLDFRLGALNRTTAVSPFANSSPLKAEQVTYGFVNASGAVPSVHSQGILLAQDKKTIYQQSHYIVPAGSNADFTLYVIAELPKDGLAVGLQINDVTYLYQDTEDNLTLSHMLPSRVAELQSPKID